MESLVTFLWVVLVVFLWVGITAGIWAILRTGRDAHSNVAQTAPNE